MATNIIDMDQMAKTVGDNLKLALIELIKMTVDGAKAAGTFLKEQIPDVIRQLLTWKLAEAIVIVSAMVVATIILLLMWKWFWKITATWGNDERQRARGFAGSCAVFLPIGIMFFFVVGYVKDIVMILVAPKVYLIQYSVELIKSIKQ